MIDYRARDDLGVLYCLRDGLGDRKIGGMATFADVLELLHPQQFLTAKQFGRLRRIWKEQRAIRLAKDGAPAPKPKS